MRLAAASLALLPAITVALEGYHGPGLFGAPPLKVLRGIEIDYGSDYETRGLKESRQEPIGGTDGRCGSDFGGTSCAEGYCCSPTSWCGNNSSYCSAPNCQYQYGSGCGTNEKPSGPDTFNTDRPHLGSVPYGGAGIYHCTVPGTVALTYDDGPSIYTNAVLDLLNQYDAKATFFISGNNNGKGMIDSTPAWSAVIQRMANDGHQVASHTWSHQNLDKVSDELRKQEILYNEIALQNILGYFPTYMRPPYSGCITPSCMQDMADLGYHISYFDVDTDDYNNLTPESIQTAKNNFADAVVLPTTNKFLSISHDLHPLSTQDLTLFMLDRIQALGFRAVTMGECLGDPIQNWYRSGNGGTIPSASLLAPTAASSDPENSSPTPAEISSGGGSAAPISESSGGPPNPTSAPISELSGGPPNPTSATPPPSFTGAASANLVVGLVVAIAFAIAAF
ncbi:glycoside hydrolase/deacetylase [Eremomyces bilateralis CBS 781.70]|uniref:Glycoside hydrolase/deacetylase n=1 Tax=Eremomyces bilateralis CBS 781.70 TaxID=1392243 RepID=A0A6G1G0M0_9PEZI|nr:glycoside hydrolase/deacetylase [Eremomyces bilateralis CBS 781.70]KAF1811657.1 glycoside hydrolase/deacetylase [Eremomyces bilateralis CBS 781.70]